MTDDPEVAAILAACTAAGIRVGTNGANIAIILPLTLSAAVRAAFIKALTDRSQRVMNFILAENGCADECRFLSLNSGAGSWPLGLTAFCR
jgi:hypothetical protein